MRPCGVSQPVVPQSRLVASGRRRRCLVAVGLAVTAACSGGTHHTAAPVTTTTSPPPTSASTTTTVDPTKAAILESYRAEWADFLAVADSFPVRPLDMRLEAHATGNQLHSVRQALTRLSLQNHYDQGPTVLSPVVIAVDTDAATVLDCIFDQSVEMDSRTKAPVERPNAGHTLDRFAMSRVNGKWYVSDSTIVRSGRTEDACVPGAV
jgi:hypothetical protein